jgi:LacI family transcriptional regulator
MVTLKEIAKEAGVSVMTVSNVVNGNLSKVSKENAKRIQKIIDERNYVPNLSARSLAKNNSNIIAIILRGDQNENLLQSPHNAALVGVVIQKVQQHDYYTMVNIVHTQDDILHSLRTWNVGGAIFLGMFDNEIDKICQSKKIPMVFIDSYSNNHCFSNVGIDDYKGGVIAAQHLLSRGHRKIAFVGPPPIHNGVIHHRFAGFCDELSKNGIPFNPHLQFVLESDILPNDIIETGRKLADFDGVTAAFVTSDQIASYVIQGLRLRDKHVPEDFSIVGFDNSNISTHTTPQLTTIGQDVIQKGNKAVEILFKQLKSPDSPVESIVLDVKLVERESVGTITPEDNESFMDQS